MKEKATKGSHRESDVGTIQIPMRLCGELDDWLAFTRLVEVNGGRPCRRNKRSSTKVKHMP
jgi:hypothetical protein